MAIKAGCLLIEWIVKADNTLPPLKLCDGTNSTKDTRRRGFAARIFTFLPLDGNNWSANPGTSSTLGNIFPAHVEFVGRREVVQRRIPLRSRIRFIRQHKLALRSRHNQWLRPRVEVRVVNDLEDAANTKIVIANRCRVSRIALQLV